jgi:predicted rRNA methylase YqxC with S4 and FtsJ domains
LDAELVRRGLARSREQASGLIADGHVSVAGMRATKASTGVSTDQPIVVNHSPISTPPAAGTSSPAPSQPSLHEDFT